MASYDLNTSDDKVQRPKELIMMGSKTRKAQCTTLYVCDSIKDKDSQRLRSILGVLPWARTKNEYTMDDFSISTIREPWLLKRISTSNASTWLAGKGIDATRSSRFAAQDQVDRTFQKIITKKRMAKLRSSIVSCTDNDFMRKFQNRLAYTFTYFANLGFWTTHCFESAILFKVDAMHILWRHYAHVRAVWCSWCTLGWLVTHMSQWLQGQSKVERICVTSCYLTTKIPSALLVAVGWLQDTRYPRFHRRTFGYGVTTSPIQRGKAKVRSFHVNVH
jgi:hypothetical protein